MWSMLTFLWVAPGENKCVEFQFDGEIYSGSSCLQDINTEIVSEDFI